MSNQKTLSTHRSKTVPVKGQNVGLWIKIYYTLTGHISVSGSVIRRQYIPPKRRYPRNERHDFVNQSTTIGNFTRNSMMPMWTGVIYAGFYFYFCIIKFIQILSKISVHSSQKTWKFSIKNATNLYSVYFRQSYQTLCSTLC